ncbi:MAG: WYL domain-containing protein [Saprospiraceae bacterium]|nr:WYL domain-containing protein [Candidatus Vicinibacter affinis]
MATNKHALIRYKILDGCFRNSGKRYYIEDLIKACEKILLEIDPSSNGISRRQIFEDISFMESVDGWQIELQRIRDGKRCYYRYSDPNFSINNMPLNEIELANLESAINILSQFKGMPQFEWVNELVPKIKQGIDSKDSSSAIIEFDNNQYLKGIEHLGTLHNGIFYKKVLSVVYHPFESEKQFNVIIHPSFLKQYNNRWFLFGYNPESERYDWNLAIDRIVSIDEINSSQYRQTIIDWQEYFEDIVGVTKPFDLKIESVLLYFKGKTGNYIETKPIHGSQKSKWLDKNTLEVKLQLIINYEFERLILSYAENVIVRQPVNLVNTIKTRLTEAINQY